MIDKFLDLRNRIHAGEFRFDVTPDLWKIHYQFGNEAETANNVLKVMDNGTLVGYAVFSIDSVKGFKACRILDVCAQRKEVSDELIDRLTKRCQTENVDFIYFKQGAERFGDVLSKRGFFTTWESVIMVTLLNPAELFDSLSEEVNEGKILKLVLSGFNPISIKVGRNGFQTVADEKPNLTVATDGDTFLRLLFGQTPLIKEVIKQRVRISGMLNFLTAKHFFDLIKQKRWFIPSGDWL